MVDSPEHRNPCVTINGMKFGPGERGLSTYPKQPSLIGVRGSPRTLCALYAAEQIPQDKVLRVCTQIPRDAIFLAGDHTPVFSCNIKTEEGIALQGNGGWYHLEGGQSYMLIPDQLLYLNSPREP